MNRLRSYVWMVCLLCASALAGSCSREVVSTPVGGPDASGSSVEAGSLRIVIRTPSPDAVVNPGSRAEAEDGEEPEVSGPEAEEPAAPVTVEDEVQEWTVKKLGVYIFMAQNAGAPDGDYRLVKKTEGITFGEKGIPGELGTDLGNGTYSYTEPLEDWMIGKYLKVLLVANEQELPVTLDGKYDGSGGTSLENFRLLRAGKELASRADQRADVISGGAYTGDGDLTGGTYEGIVMSGTAKKDTQTEEIYLQYPSSLELEATLTRIVARIDICLNKKNLKLKEAFLKNTARKACLFPQETVFAPGDSLLTAYPLLPVSAYAEKLGADKEGVSYQPAAAEDEEAAVTRANNTLKHVFYLYEQENSAASCATVVVRFTLTDDAGEEQDGELEIPFRTVSAEGTETYVPVTRNHLYTVELGDGSLDGKTVISRLVVVDWEPNEVEDYLNPDEEVVQ